MPGATMLRHALAMLLQCADSGQSTNQNRQARCRRQCVRVRTALLVMPHVFAQRSTLSRGRWA